MTESKPRESDEQLAERLSKRHCWPHDKISDVFEYGFQAGYLQAIQAEREKVRELVDAVKPILERFIRGTTIETKDNINQLNKAFIKAKE